MVLVVGVLVRPSWRAKLGIAVGLLCLLTWWLTIPPRQFRDWQTGCALTAHAEIGVKR